MKIGIFGVGHLGKIHIKCLKETDWKLVGAYDPNASACQATHETFGIKIYEEASQLIDVVDAVDIVSTTSSHFEIAKRSIECGKHVFIEKPIATTAEEALLLVRLAKDNNVKIQVGHVERYNPAWLALSDRRLTPKFIEGHRLATFNVRGNDVSVVHDLMIHDLDLILSLIDSDIRSVQANGVCVVNDTPDICNVRITFENDTVVNLTASRISMKQMRKLRLFQEDEYISIDLLKKESQIIALQPATDDSQGMVIETSAGKKEISILIPEKTESNAIVEELRSFYRCVKEDTSPLVDGAAGYRALELAERIEKML